MSVWGAKCVGLKRGKSVGGGCVDVGVGRVQCGEHAWGTGDGERGGIGVEIGAPHIPRQAHRCMGPDKVHRQLSDGA